MAGKLKGWLMSNAVILTRKELYEKVWSKPMVQLAKEFNLSDVGLAKICRKYKIPGPGLGYWATKECGKQVEVLPLPDNDKNPEIGIDVSGKGQWSYTLAPRTAEAFVVPDRLTNPHPLVLKTKAAFETDDRAYYGKADILDI